jgi:hypothetical protein
MTTRITANQREILSVADTVSGTPFYLRGNSADGSLNVNITSGVISSIGTITGTVTVQDISAENSLATISNILTKGTINTNNAQINGNDIADVAPGTQLVSLAGPTGDPIDTFGNALKTYGQITDDLGSTPSVLSPTTQIPAGVQVPLAVRNNSLITAPATSAPITWTIKSVTTTPGYYVGNYRWVSVQVTQLYVGTTPTITFQGSNDNINWYSVSLNPVAANPPVSSTTTTGIWSGPINFLYFRLNFTGTYTSGVSNGQIVFSTSQGALNAIYITPTTTVNVGGLKTNNAAIPDATELGVLPAVANASNPAYKEGFQVLQSSDLSGNTRIISTLPLLVNQAQVAGDDVATTAPGVSLMSLAGPTGDPVDTVGNALAVSASGTVKAQSPLVTIPVNGQAKIASTGTAVNLSVGVLTNGVIISAPSGNAAPILLGVASVKNTVDGTGNGYALAAGASISFAIANTNQLWINGTANDYISWAGS